MHLRSGTHTSEGNIRGATYIGGVGDQLTQENFFVGVESVDDQAHQLVDLRLEGVSLGSSYASHVVRDELWAR